MTARGEMTEQFGRLTGSREPSPSGLGPSGFDRERNPVDRFCDKLCADQERRNQFYWNIQSPTERRVSPISDGER